MQATVKHVPNHEKRCHRWVKNVQDHCLDACFVRWTRVYAAAGRDTDQQHSTVNDNEQSPLQGAKICQALELSFSIHKVLQQNYLFPILTMCYHPRVIIGDPEAPTKTLNP